MLSKVSSAVASCMLASIILASSSIIAGSSSDDIISTRVAILISNSKYSSLSIGSSFKAVTRSLSSLSRLSL